jgi:hypothetical protein
MPRKASSVPKKQRSSSTGAAFASQAPRMMSEEEKHRMIMAHAAIRAPQDPLQRISLWAGVTLSVAAIATGWWFTVGQGIQYEAGQGSQELRRAAAELDKFTQMVESSAFLNAPTNNPTSNANAGSFDELMRSNLPEQRNLFAPSDTGPDTQADATSTPPTPSTAPSVPAGLTPDP